jgi:hypothetical protein
LAKELNVSVSVVSTTTDTNGRITAWQQNFTYGVTHRDRVIVVGYNRETAHYVAFRTDAEMPSHSVEKIGCNNMQDTTITHGLKAQVNVFGDHEAYNDIADECMCSDFEPDDSPMDMSFVEEFCGQTSQSATSFDIDDVHTIGASIDVVVHRPTWLNGSVLTAF